MATTRALSTANIVADKTTTDAANTTTQAQVTALVATAGYTPFFLMGA